MNLFAVLRDGRRRKKEWAEHDGDGRTEFVLQRLAQVVKESDRVADDVVAAARRSGARVAG